MQARIHELHNPGDSAVDLTGWWLQNCGAKKSELEGRPPGGYFVMARSSNREVVASQPTMN